MPQHHRILYNKIPNSTMLPVVHIRSADPNRMHPQEDLIGTRFWDRTVFQAQVPGSVHHHGQVLPRRRHGSARLGSAPGSKGRRRGLRRRGRPLPPAALRAGPGAAPRPRGPRGPSAAGARPSAGAAGEPRSALPAPAGGGGERARCPQPRPCLGPRPPGARRAGAPRGIRQEVGEVRARGLACATRSARLSIVWTRRARWPGSLFGKKPEISGGFRDKMLFHLGSFASGVGRDVKGVVHASVPKQPEAKAF